MKIPFNKPHLVGKELEYIRQAVLGGKISGDGIFTKKCHRLIEKKYAAKKVLLTTSCSTALDMAALLFNIKSGDEVILPSFSFPSVANSFLMQGAKLKFVDIRQDTLNIDEEKIEEAINRKTKAIVPVHYAGVACEMDKILKIAKSHGILVVEDSAQAMEAKYKDKYLGTIGDLGCYSFHETKNYISGEGGALIINNLKYLERAEILREKGTNRNKFFRGEVDKYTWVDIGSSYLPSEIISAFLYAQLENAEKITKKRLAIWEYYYEKLEELEQAGFLRRPVIPDDCIHNGHMFYLILHNSKTRDGLMDYLKEKNIYAPFHFLPLHLSPMGRKAGYNKGDFPITENLSQCIIRLPFYYSITRKEQDEVIKNIIEFTKNNV